MTTLVPVPVPLYRNALEPLVTDQVKRQLEQLSPKLVKYINPEQVIAYALNRLPPLYATSVEGWTRQQEIAKTKLEKQIFLAVRQGLAAVQRDPLKVSTPLVLLEDNNSEN
jgi:Late competence development protein ComFB